MIGAFNGWNILAAYTTALAIDLPVELVEEAALDRCPRARADGADR